MPQYKFDTPALKGAKSSISQAMKKRTEDRRKKEKEQFSVNPPLKKMKYSEQMKERMKSKKDKGSYYPTQPDDGKYNRKGVEYEEDRSIEGPDKTGLNEYRRQLEKKYSFIKMKQLKKDKKKAAEKPIGKSIHIKRKMKWDHFPVGDESK